MTRAERDRIATPMVLAYWLTLVGGLVLYTTTRAADGPVVVALWLGALGGTMLGQYLAMRDYRLWVTGFVLAVTAIYGAPLVPDGVAGTALGQAFIPAVLCGFWSLGDRASLAACWFPAVIWLLSILDRTGSSIAPDGVGATLLAGFAVAFLALLRARETRRVGLWQAVGAVALATTQPTEVLREPPGRQLASAAWGLSVAGIAVAITVWIAPRLWQVETLDGPPAPVAAAGSGHAGSCCPIADEAETASARVKDYLDLGRGHDPHTRRAHDRAGCRPCPARLAAQQTRTTTVPPVEDPWPAASTHESTTPSEGATAGTGYAAGGTLEGGGAVGTVESGTVESGTVEGGTVASGAVATGMDVAAPPEPTAAPPIPAVATAAPPLPTTQPRPALPVTPTATPSPTPLPTIQPPPAADGPPPPSAPTVGPSRTAPAAAASIVPLLIALATAALLFQILALALRPVRRLITLRHLRRPFWDETVDQRVSNAWQLALVGLHDAGWRPGAHEAPHALARRVGVPELERCATILERARHSLGIDGGDLDAMHAAADAAYHAARRGLGTFARVVGWIRWPLT